MVPWLGNAPHFPPPHRALRDPNGLLAAGGSLAPEWLLAAYPQGIFPWFNHDEPILWWSPDPRMVVVPGEQRISRSLLRTLRTGRFELRCDTCFADVVAACAAPRAPGVGTWIVPSIQQAYLRLHELGWAHSIEAWEDGELVGGLYGVAIGRVFFGESMFHRRSDASKVAFAHLARTLEREKFAVIDCEMTTAHLASLGGREIPRADFVAGLATWTREGVAPGKWATDFAAIDWSA